jgi:hypothetical protein
MWHASFWIELYHYFEGNSDFAALHLAGAAEELLGKFLRARNRIPIFENLREVTVRLSRLLSNDGSASSPQAIADLMNHAKNHLKHSTDAGTYDARGST